MNVIVYRHRNGTLAMSMPTSKALEQYGIEEIARKDVPYGVPYLLVPAADLPQDAPQESWEADFSNPTGIGLGQQRWFIEQAAAVISNPESTPEQIEAAMRLSEQMQDEILQLEGAPL